MNTPETSLGLASAALEHPDPNLAWAALGRPTQEVDQVAIETDGPSVNILYLSDLLIGHKDAAVDFYERTIQHVTELPEDMQPDAIVLTGLLQGDFRFTSKTRQITLDPEYKSIDSQFAKAKELLDLTAETGCPIIYNLSDDDRRIARDYTVEVFRRAKTQARNERKSARDADPDFDLTYYQVDRLQQDAAFNEHYDFHVNTVLPYCLRSGRRLRSAEEMAEASGGEVAEEEYLLLVDTCKAIARGGAPNPTYTKHLEMANINSEDDRLIITDDVNLHITTEGREYTDWVRHSWGFSPQTTPRNHLGRPIDTIKQLAADGQKTPDMLIMQGHQETVGVGMPTTEHAAWAIATSGLVEARNLLNTRGTVAGAPGDISRRLVATRGRIPTPNATALQRTDDGRLIATFFNDALQEKSHSIDERMTIAEICDLQTGSITARPDLLVKYIDYVRTRALGERALAVFFGGDMIHGRNYPDFPRESQSTGLMSIDSQVLFNKLLFSGAFNDISAEELKGLERVLVQVGNHEWNSGTLTQHGYSFADYMQDFFGRMLARAGYSDAEIDSKVKFQDSVVTRSGDYFKNYTGIERFGDMGVLIQHYMLDRGGKGSGGGLPVHQAFDYTTGAGDLMSGIDVQMAGHWHHPQYALHGNKLAVVGGSMAGQSGYELMRGYRAVPAGTLIHLGGGLPPQVEFISQEALNSHRVTTGEFSEANLRAAGFQDDRDFDAGRHGIMLPDSFPKSALQKAIRQRMRQASQSAGRIAQL
jgi:hypothetical protein